MKATKILAGLSAAAIAGSMLAMVNVSAADAKDYTVDLGGKTYAGLANLGFGTFDDGETAVVNSITINGYEFNNEEFSFGKTLTSAQYDNGLGNIWNLTAGQYESADKTAVLEVTGSAITLMVDGQATDISSLSYSITSDDSFTYSLTFSDYTDVSFEVGEGGGSSTEGGVLYTGSRTMTDSAWWTQEKVSIDELLGGVDPADVGYIRLSSDTTFFAGYNTVTPDGKGGWEWEQNGEALNEIIIPADKINLDGENYGLELMISKGDGVPYTINWEVFPKGASVPGTDEPGDDVITDNVWAADVSTGARERVVNIAPEDFGDLFDGYAWDGSKSLKVTITGDIDALTAAAYVWAQPEFHLGMVESVTDKPEAPDYNLFGWPDSVFSGSAGETFEYDDEGNIVPYEYVYTIPLMNTVNDDGIELEWDKIAEEGLTLGGYNVRYLSVDVVTTDTPVTPPADESKPDDSKDDSKPSDSKDDSKDDTDSKDSSSTTSSTSSTTSSTTSSKAAGGAATENPATGAAALGAVGLILAGAAMVVSKKKD